MANVPPRVAELIETFDRNIDAYKNQQYNEAQLRREFIDPFFEALGWDITNKRGLAQAYKDVIHEDAIKIGGYTKAPDYCFRIGGTRKFFLEAKKPSIDIKGDPHPAYQLRRYAWSSKLPLSILTDFEEFAVYDCQIRPKQTDKAGTARIIYLKYKDYIDHWDEIANIFSKDAILKGSFDKFAVSPKGKRGTTTVDKEFLAELEKWRADLARIIALRNTTLSAQEINFAVQRTIDRIIFLRMAEDRGIEPYAQLQGVSSGDRTYPRLCELFEKADHKYNSGLFYFQEEPGRPEGPDELTLNLVVDDGPLRYILDNLYYPKCPYEFSVLPPEILGNVYEQFLGSVIQVSLGRRTKVEPKPEVKKAGGIYYTPTYIVDYIVKNTVGKLLGDPSCHSREGGNPPRHCEERSNEAISNKVKTKNHVLSEVEGSQLKTPKQVENLRILDPACGSGSFLLSAYTHLLNHHRDWYVDNNPEKYTKQIYQGRGGQWYLTIAEKKRILLNSIFGVDIDSQAVEVTKLSLLLKVLEGETSETIGQTYRMFHERALPDLGNNIKCGNSLIGPDFYEDKDPDSFSEEQRRRINPFDYKTEFPQIFSGKNLGAKQRSAEASAKADGFDAVIGNPPYGIQFDIQLKAYLEALSPSFVRNNDMFAAFMEKALSLTCSSGHFGFIVPNTYLLGPYFNQLKQYILTQAKLVSITDFGFALVFPKPNVFTCITTVEKRPQHWSRDAAVAIAKVEEPESISNVLPKFTELTQDQRDSSLEWAHSSALVNRLRCSFPDLDQFCLVKDVGLNYWTVGRGKKRGGSIADRVLYQGKQQHTNDRPFLKGRNVDRYQLESPSSWLKHDWPKHIDPSVDKFRFDENVLCQEKLVYRQTADHLRCALDPHEYLTDKTVHSIVWLPHRQARESYMYLLGILNSRLFRYLYQASAHEAGRTFAQVKIYRIRSMPFRPIDFSDSADKTKHDNMIKLVDRMLDLHKRLTKAKVPAEKTRIQRQINTTDKQIDKLVYQLYNLTPEEIAIIEGNSK